MYADKPMQGHGLIRAIARVNRVFRDRPGGLVLDYLGFADQLRKALISGVKKSVAIYWPLREGGPSWDQSHGEADPE